MNTLELFSREELYVLDDFLRSPYYFNEKQQSDTYPLFQYILQHYGDWEHPDLEKSKIYPYLYPNQKVINGKIDKLMSALLKQIHLFISIHFRKWKDDPIQDMIFRVEFFRYRNSAKFEIQYLEKAKKEYLKLQMQDKQYYFNGFLIGQEEIQRNLVLDQRLVSFDFNAALQPLDAYYLLNKLEYACFLLSQDYFRKPLDITTIVQFLDAVKPLYDSQGLLNIPLVGIYYQAYEMLKKLNDDDSAYWKLKELIVENEQAIPPDPLKVLNGLMRGFIIHRFNYGAVHLLEEIFTLHKDHLERGYLNFENGILPSTFKNIVNMGLRLKDFDWVFWFLNDYKDKIEGTSKPEDVYAYNLASYYFALKEYDKALELLADQYEDLYYKIAAKRLELKVCFETRSTILEAKMDAFKVYIYRLPKKVILDHKRASNNNFINFLRQINNPKTAFSASRIEKLRHKIENSHFLTEEDWLLEKIQDFKNN